MSQDGIFIGKLSEELRMNLIGGRIDNVIGLNKSDYVLDVRVPGHSHYVYMSVSYNNPTIFMTDEKFEKPGTVSNFCMLLRKYLVGAFISDIKQLDNDRVIKFSFDKKDDLTGNTVIYLIIELIGRFSNLLLLDEDMRLIDAIKQMSILENNQRGIMRGLEYIPLRNDKISPYDTDKLNNFFSNNENLYEKNLVEHISGISPSFAKYLIRKYMDSNEGFGNFLYHEISKFDPVLTTSDFYFFNIFDTNSLEHFNTLSSLLNTYYKRNAEAKILKDNNQKVYQCVSSNLKRVTKKLINLNNDLSKDLNSDELRIKGEILLANLYQDVPRTSSITLKNFYDDKDITISLDPSKSLKDNANIYFKKYRKAKNAVEHLNEQIRITTDEKEYFELIDYQLKSASLKDIQEIKEELIQSGYLRDKTYRPSKKKQKPNFKEYKVNGCRILVGKNNIQNDYITNTIARKEDLWFHVKDAHGSHVVVSGDNKYDEEVIRFASIQAAINSEAHDSSSVPVDYTLIKYIKKIPGKKGSNVSYTHQKTIYVDPKRED